MYIGRCLFQRYNFKVVIGEVNSGSRNRKKMYVEMKGKSENSLSGSEPKVRK